MIPKEESMCRKCEKLESCVDSTIELIMKNLDDGEKILNTLGVDEHFAHFTAWLYESLEKRIQDADSNANRLREIVGFAKAIDEYARLCTKERDFSASSPEVRTKAVDVLTGAMGNEKAGNGIVAMFFNEPNFPEALVSDMEKQLAYLATHGARKELYARRLKFFKEFATSHRFRVVLAEFVNREGDFSKSSDAVKLQAVDAIVTFLQSMPGLAQSIAMLKAVHDNANPIVGLVFPQLLVLSQTGTSEQREFFSKLAEFVRDRIALRHLSRQVQEAQARSKDSPKDKIAEDSIIVGAWFCCLETLMPDSWKKGGRDDAYLATAKNTVDWLFDDFHSLVPDATLKLMNSLPMHRDDDNKLAYFFSLCSHLQGRREQVEKREKAEAQVDKFFETGDRTLPQVIALMDESPEMAEATAKFAFQTHRDELFTVVKVYLAEKARTDERYKVVEETARTNAKAREVMSDIAQSLGKIIAKIREDKPEAAGCEPNLN